MTESTIQTLEEIKERLSNLETVVFYLSLQPVGENADIALKATPQELLKNAVDTFNEEQLEMFEQRDVDEQPKLPIGLDYHKLP